MKKRRYFFSLVLLAVLMVFSSFPVSALNSGYPYPGLLDYSDLDSSFNRIAESQILPQYRKYVLEAIKYHIESANGDYRTAKNLLSLYDSPDGNVVFFFDGCSNNLEGASYTSSGYIKNGSRYNTSAVCIVVKLNNKGIPEIVYASEASTMADNVRNAQLNDGTPPSILIDGIYNIKLFNHMGYAAFQIETKVNSGVRCCTYKSSYLSQGSGIDIHARGRYSSSALTSSTYSSTGCFNVGKHNSAYDYSDYNEFIRAATGFAGARANGSKGDYPYQCPTSCGYYLNDYAGIVIVDRSNYYDALKKIFGNDSDFGISGGWSAVKIADSITKNSAVWHNEIVQRIENTESLPIPAGEAECAENWTVTANSGLNCRSGPGTNYSVVSAVKKGEELIIAKKTTLSDGSLWGWGRGYSASLNRNLEGWYCLDYVAFNFSYLPDKPIVYEEPEDDPDDEIPYEASAEPSSPETGKISVLSIPFSDVSEKAKYYQAVCFVYEKGLMIGTSDTEFSPDMTMTRAMFVTILGRMEKIDPDRYKGSSFSDVPAGEWFSPYVIWATENGLVLGYGDGTFGPEDEITMEQAALLLARYEEYRGTEITSGTELSGYSDGADVSDWAVSAMCWALDENIYVTDGKCLLPKKPAERSALAEMLYAFGKQ